MSILFETYMDDGTAFSWKLELDNGVCGKQIIAKERLTNYIITIDGYVYNINSNLRLKTQISNKGYKTINLQVPGCRYVTQSIHKLIALGYLPLVKDKPIINHIDGNKLNNSIDNLEWCTYSENNRHAYRTGLKVSNPRCGEESNLTKHSKNEVIQVCKLLQKGYTTKALHDKFGISVGFSSKIYHRKSWTKISKKYNFSRVLLYNNHFSIEDTDKIATMYRACVYPRGIMKLLGLKNTETNRSNIRQVIRQVIKYDKVVNKDKKKS